jgi:hypothetical protein
MSKVIQPRAIQLQTTARVRVAAVDCRGSLHYRIESDWQDDCGVVGQIAASVCPG